MRQEKIWFTVSTEGGKISQETICLKEVKKRLSHRPQCCNFLSPPSPPPPSPILLLPRRESLLNNMERSRSQSASNCIEFQKVEKAARTRPGSASPQPRSGDGELEAPFLYIYFLIAHNGHTVVNFHSFTKFIPLFLVFLAYFY